MKTSWKILRCIGPARGFVLLLFLGFVDRPTNVRAQTPGIAVTEQPFAFSDQGGQCHSLGGSSGLSGYVRLQARAGDGLPEGLLRFGVRRNDILVSETVLAAAPLMSSGRFFAELGPGVTTGFAIANPGNQPVKVTLYLTSEAGRESHRTSITITANRLLTGALDNGDYSSEDPTLRGALTFEASIPVSAVALRYFINERTELLTSALPVVPMPQVAAESITFPHYADGGGWRTELILVNPTDTQLTGTIRLLDSLGRPASLNIDNGIASSLDYSIAPRSSRYFATSGGTSEIRTGSARVVPSENNTAPAGVARFTFRGFGVTTTETAAPAMTGDTKFRTYIAASDGLHSGVAVANTRAAVARVRLDVTSLDGSAAGGSRTIDLPPFGQTAFFPDGLPDSAAPSQPLKGILQLTSDSPIVVTTLRFRSNVRGEFLISSVPTISQNGPVATSEVLLPYPALMEGSEREVVLFSGSAGASSGTMYFIDLRAVLPDYRSAPADEVHDRAQRCSLVTMFAHYRYK